MRKLLLIYLGIIVLCFLLPAILTEVSKGEINVTSADIKTEQKNIENQHIVKLYHTKTNEIEEIELEQYLYGVVAAEMPASYELEALKAQAIVARTYTVYKEINDSVKHGNASICDDANCCQAWISKNDRFEKWDDNMKEQYWEKIVSAVDATKGKVIKYDGEPINAFFHSNSGGTTEAPKDVWGGSGYPYLQTVATSGEDAYSQYASEVILTRQDIIEKIKTNHPEVEINFDTDNWAEIKEYTDGGRVRFIQMGNVLLSGVEARTLFGLKSANFKVEKEGENIKFSVIGYGHGVGMSQTGANSLAKEGKTAEEIIYHFYSGVEIDGI